MTRIEKRVGPLDPALTAAATQVWRASNPIEFYDAERAVRDAFVERADAVVAVLLEQRVKSSSLVAPTKDTLMARAEKAGLKLKSHGLRATRVRLLGGLVVSLSTLALLPVATPSRGPSSAESAVVARREPASFLRSMPWVSPARRPLRCAHKWLEKSRMPTRSASRAQACSNEGLI